MCDTLAIVEAAPRPRVLFAKNSDRDPNEAQVLEWHDAGRGLGGNLRCTWIEIPQVANTHATLICRPYWMWGAEMGTNEHGVTIGNEAVFTKSRVPATGLTGMDLLRLALERASTARDAIEVITELAATHGQGGACGHESKSFRYFSSFIIADPAEAYVLETTADDHAVERVHGRRAISNSLSIPDFARVHRDRVKSWVAEGGRRRAATTRALANVTGPADLAELLRRHEHPDGPVYRPLNGALRAPCVHGGGVVASSQTTASWVAELTDEGCRHWVTGTAAPCTSVFFPVSVDVPIETGPNPTDRFDPATLWWRHEQLHRIALRDPKLSLPKLAGSRAVVESRLFADAPPSQASFDDAEAWRRAQFASLRYVDQRPGYVRRYWEERSARAGLGAGPSRFF